MKRWSVLHPRMVRLFQVIVILTFLICHSSVIYSKATKNDVLKVMKRAADFMMNTVSTKSGFVWMYTEDMSEQWGEVPARKTMIWVQDPGTVGVGMTFLDAFTATGDSAYLAYAKKTANALIWGQHPSGGWHYFIDFDMAGVRKWYDDVFSHCWGWEEYYHYYGNCTFDDDVTAGSSRFLLRLYMTTLDPSFRMPLIKALDFVLESQYPGGGWPQRYPLMYDYPHDGHPDYTHFHTFNDEVISGNIYLLLEANEKLGDERYRDAARRGMDFVMLAQIPEPQAGWAQQYYLDMTSAPARSYEPASVMPGQTVQCIRDLMKFYTITGDSRYLRGIPDAIEWLEQSKLPESHKATPAMTHATFYEMGTNRPLYVHREGTCRENGRYWVDYEPKNTIGHYGSQITVNIESLKREYERISALSPDEAKEEYRRTLLETPPSAVLDASTVEKLFASMDSRGAWVEELEVPDFIDLEHNPPKKLRGISTETFIRNMRTFIAFINMVNCQIR